MILICLKFNITNVIVLKAKTAKNAKVIVCPVLSKMSLELLDKIVELFSIFPINIIINNLTYYFCLCCPLQDFSLQNLNEI
jgi:hypothetical protein